MWRPRRCWNRLGKKGKGTDLITALLGELVLQKLLPALSLLARAIAVLLRDLVLHREEAVLEALFRDVGLLALGRLVDFVSELEEWRYQ